MQMDVFWTVLGRSALGFGTLIFITRLIGNKQLGQLNIFTYISGIAVGTMAGAMVIYHDIEIVESFLGLLIWGAFTFLLETGCLKSRIFRRVMSGKPMIIVRHGKIDAKALIKERLHLEDLMMMLRSNDVFSITDVDYAILENNGKLSILKKSESELPTREDLGIKVNSTLPLQVVSDGKIVEENLIRYNHDGAWLLEQLSIYHIHSIREVLYAELRENDKLYIQVRDS